MAEKTNEVDKMFSVNAQSNAESFSKSPKAMKLWHSERNKTLGDLQKKHGEAMKKMGYSEGMSPSDLPDKRFAGHLGWLGSEPEHVKHTMPEMYEYYLREKKHNGPFGKPEFQTYASIFPEGEDKPRTENFNRWSNSGENYRMLSNAYIRKGKEGDYWYRQTETGDEQPISERRASELFEMDADRVKKGNEFIDEMQTMRAMGHGVDEEAEFGIAGNATIRPTPEGFALAFVNGDKIDEFDISEKQARDLMSANPMEVDNFIEDMYGGKKMKGRYSSNWHSPIGGQPMPEEVKEEVEVEEKKPEPIPEQPKPELKEEVKEEVKAEQKPVEQKPVEQKPVEQKPEENPAEEKRPDDWGEKGETVKPKTGHQRAIFNRAMKSKTKEEGKRMLEKFAYEFLIPYFVTQFVPMI